jgi:hypothetical protein
LGNCSRLAGIDTLRADPRLKALQGLIEEAIMKARELRPDAHKCEIWLENQLIAKLNDEGRFETVER